ncbi:MAG: amidohydrolase, partial [Chitinophagia bacterium]|nr:amidohydrolase [Chitinophagia bacterium]
VGDIANTTDTLAARNKGKLHFHTFVEAIGFSEHIAAKAMANAQSVLQEFGSQESTGNVMLRESITPHAPYSVSQQLFRSIAAAHPQLLSIHNQESAAENEYYQQKTGLFSNFLQGLGINDDYFIPSGKGSLPTYLQWLTGVERILLVHNTFSTQADVDATNIPGLQTFWCLCPNANLYIENCLPDVQLLRKLKQHICIGTDSLASNDTLDVYRELHTLHTSFPEIEWEELLKWATFNGAVALGLQQHVGQIVPGMAPGIVHIEQPYDKANYRVTVIA